MMSASATQGGLNNKLTAEISRFFYKIYRKKSACKSAQNLRRIRLTKMVRTAEFASYARIYKF